MYQKASYNVTCEFCGKPFESHNKSKRYCSKICRCMGYNRASGRVKSEPFHKTCVICGKPFDSYRNATITCHDCYVAKRGNKTGVHHAKFGECWHYVETQAKEFNERHDGFTYIESRKTGYTKRIRLKCNKCGNIIERAASTCRQKGLECEFCKETDAKTNSKKKAQTKLVCFFYALIESKTPKKCKACGNTFYSVSPDAKYCSRKCKRGGKSYRARCKKYGVYYDSSVTLPKIIARDNGICQICGKKCDENDRGWGTIGANAPTIDHIIPLAKGGTHTFGNVQLAHAICNSYKRDLVEIYDGEQYKSAEG